MTIPTRRISLVSVVMIAAVLSACGSGGSAAVTTTVAATTVPVATTTSTTTSPASTTTAAAACVDTGLPGGSISTVGIGSINFGMTVAQAVQGSGVCLEPVGPVDDCYAVRPVGGPDGLTFVVVEGTIERLDVSSGELATRSGVGIGTADARVRELFAAQLEIRPHPTKLGATELVFVPQDEADAAFRVVFETDGEAVTAIRSGRLPVITNPAACP